MSGVLRIFDLIKEIVVFLMIMFALCAYYVIILYKCGFCRLKDGSRRKRDLYEKGRDG